MNRIFFPFFVWTLFDGWRFRHCCKAPDKKLGVKELVKQAVLSVKKGKGGLAAGFDGKQLKRALRKRLKTCDRVEIRGSEAIYSRGSA